MSEKKQPIVAEKPDLKTIKGFESVWQNYEKTVANLLVNKYGISVEEFMTNAVNSVRQNPKLLQCTPKSLFGAMLVSAECGLKFNTPSNHAYIIPYKGEAQFQIGYQGLIEIMYRNKRVLKIFGHPVFEKDTFDYGYGLTPYLKHKPYRGADKGRLTCVYAIVKLKDVEEPIFTVVEKSDLDAIQNLSPAKNSKFSPYNSGTDIHFWMQVKVAIKKISKLIPKTSEISNVIDIDNKISSRYKASAEIITNPKKVANVFFSEEDVFGSAFDKYTEITEEKKQEPIEESTVTNNPIDEKLLDNLSEDLELPNADLFEE
jgi:recombination protein RecT